MRVLVTGGRDYADAKRVFAELDALMRPAFAAGDKEFVVIHGNEPGAQFAASAWAARRNVEQIIAGEDHDPLTEQEPRVVLAFPGDYATPFRAKTKTGVKVVTVE